MAINKLHVFDSMDDGGEASVYATVEWSGNVKQTRMVKKANINETLFFNIPIDEAIRKNSNKLSEFLNDELETKSEIVFNIWADTG